ncbi:MAG UNVERIFIED_CONTAM: hypothetical protein LVT10_11930 [Anaerolineae bacterium]
MHAIAHGIRLVGLTFGLWMKLMLNRKVVIVLPTYNEKENLPRMVQALFELEIPTLPS